MSHVQSQHSLVHEGKRTRSRPLIAAVWWAVFAMGLLIQAFAPRLTIENNAFVIPQALVSGGNPIAPDELIARERRLQLLSAITTLAGALGLAFHYRGVLVRHSSS